ncbi:MAG: VOC family protein [Thermotogota bacterium]
MKPLFNNIDCLQLYVPDLEAGIDYYCHQMGLKIIWKTQTAVGLGMAQGMAEIVIQNERKGIETDIKVDSVVEAVKEIEKAGGSIISGPFDIKIGKCAIVQDPWGNQYVILDSTKGTFITDDDGKIIGQNKSY